VTHKRKYYKVHKQNLERADFLYQLNIEDFILYQWSMRFAHSEKVTKIWQNEFWDH